MPIVTQKLTAQIVREIMSDCLFLDDEDKSSAVIVESVINKFGFHPERLRNHKEQIHGLLQQLPAQFQIRVGGGWSFLNACETAEGDRWGEHADIESLMALGLAVGLVSFPMPRKMWKSLPGGMPYFAVLEDK